MTITAADEPQVRSAPVQPTERCYGLGELIYAHRTYMGISQRAMAARLEFDRRDYQRIENGRNMCPVGFLTKVTELVDLFDATADALVDQARKAGGVTILIDTDPRWEWERNVAGRAAMFALTAEDQPRITLTSKQNPVDIRSPR
ncbi:hypothetical protein KAYACHO_38 [Mycobacterium phage KayaCho]|uniref:HTH DNA binding protein n=1 Tax=Mycobacterium phage KayaCho TaxID=1340830 RepID=UPI0003881C75|nr:HTH DNA binding protein [Mycobacterium phage KayaCho]AGT12942.1 hypothetical protein KAYACHO_38 [Mycobacterium phage KayaCho]